MPTFWLDADAADAYIAEHAVAGDVVITAGVPLAVILVPNRIYVIDPRGPGIPHGAVLSRSR